jgi:hypothetical protein
MNWMFAYTPFNGDISSWDVSKVVSMSNMFRANSNFNQDLSNWKLDNLGKIDNNYYCPRYGYNGRELDGMFYSAVSFDQDLGGWNVSNVKHAKDMFKDVNLSTTNYDNLLIGWNAQTLQQNVEFSAGNSKYSTSSGATPRQSIIDTYHWTIIDRGPE